MLRCKWHKGVSITQITMTMNRKIIRKDEYCTHTYTGEPHPLIYTNLNSNLEEEKKYAKHMQRTASFHNLFTYDLHSTLSIYSFIANTIQSKPKTWFLFQCRHKNLPTTQIFSSSSTCCGSFTTMPL